ncbi:MAG: cupin domain-containing protein [Clostridia bacterium]|nr:cupin domain-containing protein [Clostridia bacterium]
MEVVRPSEARASVNPRGEEVRFLIDRPSVSVVMLPLRPGQEAPRHVTPVDVLFYVADGAGEITVGDESAQVSAGDFVVSPATIPHGLKAPADRGFSVFVIKAPNPKR